MQKKINNNLYKFSVTSPWQFTFVVILYLIGAVGVPNNLFKFMFGNSMNGLFASQILVKILCCIMPIWLIFEIKVNKIFSFKGFLKGILITLPFILVAVNNFPIVSLIEGKSFFLENINVSNWILYIFAIFFSVLLEELTFRGLIFPTLLRKFEKTKNGDFLAILISSSLFGCVHIVNLLSGASFGAVVLQIGYSLLIGGMCSITLLKTGCFSYAVLLHFIFNVGGLLLENNMIKGNIWTPAEIIVTAVIGVIVFVYALLILFLHKKECIHIRLIFNIEENEIKEN